jgi:site-specific DNA recombinase
MIAGVYARKSTEQHVADDAKSVTRQVERAKEYATKKGWRFDDRYVFTDDAVSGREFRKRPGLRRMIEMVEGKRHPDVLILSEISRLGREQIETAYILKQILDEGVRVFAYLDDKEITLNSAVEKLTVSLGHFASESETEKGSQRVRDKMRQLAEQGRYTGGRLFGYMVENGTRTIKPSEAAIIRRIFKRRADGAGYFKIARELERDGIASPRGGKVWSPTQVGLLLTNEMYNGTIVYSKTRQTKRRGTSVTLKSPESIIRTEAPALRIITPERWKTVQAVNQASTAATWRSKVNGQLKSRPTESKHLLTPFLACGQCGGSFYVRVDNKKEFLHCANHHHYGRKGKCSNGHRLSVVLAEKAITQAFESALVGNIVMTKLAEVLEAHRQAQQDPAPLQAEAKVLRQEITRLVDQAARGEMEEIHEAARTRKARLAEIEEQLAGTTAAEIDVEAFRADVEAALADWRGHLRKNPSTAQQVLRKILPERLKVTKSTKPGVLWEFDGMTDYKKVLEEVGLGAVTTALEPLVQLPRTGRPS